MADQKQSEFPSASTLTGSEYVAIVQSAASKKSLLSSIKTFVLQGVSSLALTGLSTATNAAITATDSILVAFGKLQAQANYFSSLLSNCTPVLVLAKSAVAVSTPASTTEEVLATITIPAGIIGDNGQLRVYTLWSSTSSANTKTPRVRFGGTSGTAFLSATLTTSATTQVMTLIRNRSSASSQVGNVATVTASFGVSSGSITTATVDTSVATTLVITGQKAVSGETLTLESYTVEVIK